MIKPYMWALAALCTPLLHSYDDLEKKAKQLFEAGDYRAAIHCYENLMKEPKKNFQKEILNYNIATAYLADRQFEKAYNEFSHILSQAERYPKHLSQRARYNQLLSQLGWVDVLLSMEESSNKKENLKQADGLIDEAFKTLNLYTESKYEGASEKVEVPEEIRELRNSIKEMKSRWKKTHQEMILGELDLAKGIKKVKETLQVQLEVVEHYFKPSLVHDFLKYALTREYISAKKEIPFWDRIKDLLQEKREEVEIQVSSMDSQEKSQEILALQKSYEIFFNEAESGHKTALDCFKEYYLKRAWVELNKAKYGLSFMQQITEGEDLFKFCLHQKCLQAEKLSSSNHPDIYFEATYETVNYLNQLAQGFSKHLEEASAHFEGDANERALREQVLKTLSQRLSAEEKPTLEKLLEDEALYSTLIESPASWLLPLYIQLESKKPLKELERISFAPKLFALKERFKIEGQFEKTEARETQIQAVSKHLALFEMHWSQGEKKQTQRALEDLLVNLDYSSLVLYHLGHIQKMYELAHRDIHFEDSYRKRIEARKNRILSFPLHLEQPEQYEGLYGQVREGLEPLTPLHEMAQSSSYRNKLHKLFLKNASLAVARLEKSLSEEKETSQLALSQGLVEQKLSLENCESTDYLFGVSDEEQEHYFTFAKASQNYPLKAVASFEELFEKELQLSASEQQDTKNHSEILKWFQAGLKEAEKAKELLSKERISWEKVIQRQKKAIEYWEKAFSSSRTPPQSGQQNGSSSNPDFQPSEQDQQQNEQENHGGEKESEIAQANSQQNRTSSMEEATEDFSQQQESRDLLQHLQEMQKNDELAPEKKQKVKRGLRPW